MEASLLYGHVETNNLRWTLRHGPCGRTTDLYTLYVLTDMVVCRCNLSCPEWECCWGQTASPLERRCRWPRKWKRRWRCILPLSASSAALPTERGRHFFQKWWQKTVRKVSSKATRWISPGVRHHICTRHFPCSLSGCSPPRLGDQGGGGEVELRGGRGGGAPKLLCFWCACSAQLRPQEVYKID